MMVDFKFDALLQVNHHREPSEVGLVEMLFGSLYQVGGAGCAIPT